MNWLKRLLKIEPSEATANHIARDKDVAEMVPYVLLRQKLSQFGIVTLTDMHFQNGEPGWFFYAGKRNPSGTFVIPKLGANRYATSLMEAQELVVDLGERRLETDINKWTEYLDYKESITTHYG